MYESSPLKSITITDHHEYQQKISEFERQWTLHKTLADEEYEFIFEWTCFCATCLELPKLIKVQQDGVSSIQFSDQMGYDYYGSTEDMASSKAREFQLKLPNYGCDDLYLHSKHYHDVEGLFRILKQSLHPRYYDPNRHILSMTFDETLKFSAFPVI